MVRAWHHLPVSLLAVLWHLVLVADYLGIRYDVALYVGGMNPEQLAWFRAMPLWMAAGWGVGVWSGVLATLLLVSRAATGAFFALSFLGWAVAAAGLVWLREPPAGAVTGDLGVAMLAAAVAVAFLLFLYARWMHRRLRRV